MPAATLDSEKLTARKLLALPPSLLTRLNGLAALKRHGSANEIALRGVEAECARLDALSSVEADRMAKLRKLAAANGEDVDLLLTRLLDQTQEPALPGMAELASAAPPPPLTVEAATAA